MYITFIADMIAKGYARKADNNGKSGKKWYIPHHGVVHPAKPEKVRVVFDCSAEYRGTSLSNQLISGPDLTNQLDGVLARFKEKPVAFIADVVASHMVGIWERQIRSARGIIAPLLQTHDHNLDEESLQTLMTETKAVINS